MGEANPMDPIYSLIGFPNETEWLEFKENHEDCREIGQDISALANSAAFHNRPCAYKIWGATDDTHELVGTSFNPYQKKAKGNQDLLIWLRTMLSENALYEFERIEHDGKFFVILTIKAASQQLVSFSRVAWIREGSSTTQLIAGSAKEAELWRRLQANTFEAQPARRDLSAEEIIELLDVDSFYRLLELRKPQNIETVLADLSEQELIVRQDSGAYAITNLGALLIARSLNVFPALRANCIRVIRYAGNDNIDKLDDQTFAAGYALALPEAERYIMSSISSGEYDDGAFRRTKTLVPQRAVREMLANAAIHQDLADTTSGPLVRIYSNRLIFTNPGASLIPSDRVLNAQPKTRNRSLVRLLRQMHLCEEGGTGWDRAVSACEAMCIPAPLIQSDPELGTTVTLFGDRPYRRLTKAERKNAVYWHACLQFARDESMSNQSLRERFGLKSNRTNMVAISRLIRECVEDGLIKEEDSEASDRYRRYVPSWA